MNNELKQLINLIQNNPNVEKIGLCCGLYGEVAWNSANKLMVDLSTDFAANKGLATAYVLGKMIIVAPELPSNHAKFYINEKWTIPIDWNQSSKLSRILNMSAFY